MSKKKVPYNKNTSASISELVQTIGDNASYSFVRLISRTIGNGPGSLRTTGGQRVTCQHLIRTLKEIKSDLTNNIPLLSKVIGDDRYSDIQLMKNEANNNNNYQGSCML
jgi:hypothetical protein